MDFYTVLSEENYVASDGVQQARKELHLQRLGARQAQDPSIHYQSVVATLFGTDATFSYSPGDKVLAEVEQSTYTGDKGIFNRATIRFIAKINVL